jgi:predicted dehydrogenase
MTNSGRRAAIIGAGLMGRWHAHAVKQIGGDIVAIVDPARDRAERLAARYGAQSAASLAAITNPVDIVHVCTPTDSHEDLITQAILAGRHVLVEKPLVATAAATRALLSRAAERGVLLCPVHQFPWQRGALRVYELLPTLGTIRHVDFTACSAGASGASALDPDRVALDILPHPFSLLSRFLPAVMTSPWSVLRPAAGEWRVSAVTDDATVSILISMSGRPTANTMRIIAEHGTAHLNLFHGFAVIEGRTVSRVRKITQPFTLAGGIAAAATAALLRRTADREYAYPGLRTLIDRFYQASGGYAAPPVSPDEAIGVAERIDAVRAQKASAPLAGC